MVIKRNIVLLLLILLICTAIAYPLIQISSPAFPQYGKGGFGIVAQHILVTTKTKENRIFYGEQNKNKWNGLEANQLEIVLAGHDGVVHLSFRTVWQIGSFPAFVIFTPAKIHFFDFQNFRGGFYRRIQKE